MKHDYRVILTDVKAAARIGHADSLWLALDGLIELPEVAGNPLLSENFLSQAVLPIGHALAQSRLNNATLRPLADQPQAALRAIAATALITRYLNGGATTLEQLSRLGQDSRKDVRQGLVLAAQTAGEQPELLMELIVAWLAAPSPRKQSVALQLLPTLAANDPGKAIRLIEDFKISSDAEVRAEVVEVLVWIANQGQGHKVIEVLNTLTNPDKTAQWVVAKTLARPWTAKYPEAAMDILGDLSRQAGPQKLVYKAILAISQQGAAEAVQTTIEKWQASRDPKLQAAAVKIKEKIAAA